MSTGAKKCFGKTIAAYQHLCVYITQFMNLDSKALCRSDESEIYAYGPERKKDFSHFGGTLVRELYVVAKLVPAHAKEYYLAWKKLRKTITLITVLSL